MNNIVWKFWRFCWVVGTGIKSNCSKMGNIDGVWKPIIKTRLMFLVEKRK